MAGQDLSAHALFHQLSVQASGTDNCDEFVTLECLRALYNFNYTLVNPDQNTVAVGESIWFKT